MNFLEICGVVFIAVIIINGLVGFIALKSAKSINEDSKITQLT